ncbi:MAG: hypothetical protein SD837_07885 [Candidatus Electrothrix scaldis]|nr:MAG: hypothetical protein SD837_07885 [Candidatus Electrothrix sp. GW3-3]
MENLILISASFITAAFLIATASFAFRAALQVSYANTRRKKAQSDLRHR